MMIRKLSINEYFFINLIVEASENSECCALSVFGDASKTGMPVVARVMDWYIDTDKKEIEHLFGVTEYRHKDYTLFTVGVIGHLGIISGIRDNGIYAAVLFSRNDSPYRSKGKFSYSLELRNAMENNDTIEGIAGHMKSEKRNYTMNHNIFLSDIDKSFVLENDVQGGPNASRRIRKWNSRLNPKVSWGFRNRIACVNSFILSGNDDNHTTVPGNQNRWLSLVRIMNKEKSPINTKTVKKTITFYPGEKPGDFDAGGLYTKWTKQIMIFDSSTMELDLFFSPRQGELPGIPEFKRIRIKK